MRALSKILLVLCLLLSGESARAQNPMFFGQNVPGGGVPFFQQDTARTCSTSGTISSCTYGIPPTVAGSARYAMFGSGSNVKVSTAYDCTISSGCTAGNALDTYTLCPTSNCNAQNPTEGDFLDGAYAAGNTAAGATFVTINFSGSAAVTTNGCVCVFSTFSEYVPPPGLTFSFDGANAAITTSCGTQCTLANPAVTGTDVVIHAIDSQTPLTNLNAGFTKDFVGNIFNLALASATALKVDSVNWISDSAISFKLSSSYTANGAPWATVNLTPNIIFNTVSCSPTCTLTVPSTSAGLGFIWAASHTFTVGHFISSISGWTVPSAANTCRVSSAGPGQLSCAYNLSLAASMTSIPLTMSATDTYDFMFYNLTDSHGTPALDVQNSATNATSLSPSGIALVLTGTSVLPDVVFQAIGTIQSPPDQNFNSYFITLYPYPGGVNDFGVGVGASALLLNTTNGTAPTWSQTPTGTSIVAAVAFKP